MEKREVTIICYIGTYLTRDMRGLKEALNKGYGRVREVLFIYDGRPEKRGELSKEEISRMMELRSVEDAKREFRWWIDRGEDTWARVSRENLIDALVRFRDLINPEEMGIEVGVRGCNPRETREAIECFGYPIFLAALRGRRVIYVEASMTRVGSPIIRWLVGITGNVTLYVPPKGWADPRETFIINPRLSRRELELVKGRMREFIAELEKELGKSPLLDRIEYNYSMEAREPEEVPILGVGCSPLLRGVDPRSELVILAAMEWARRVMKGSKLSVSRLVEAINEFSDLLGGGEGGAHGTAEGKVKRVTYQILNPRIRSLVEAGFIERERVGKKVLLSLTEGGRAFAKAFLDAVMEWRREEGVPRSGPNDQP